MAATTDLAAAVDYVTARGGSVRLVGDDRQLAAVAAGGVLRDIAHQRRRGHPDRGPPLPPDTAPRPPPPSPSATATPPPSASTPTTAASTSATSATAADQAYPAWAADRAAGDDASCSPPPASWSPSSTPAPAPTASPASEPTHGRSAGLVGALGDGTLVSRRRHDRHPPQRPEAARSAPPTGSRTATAGPSPTVHADGSMTVQPHQLRRKVRLPADYVAEHVQLGYATTIHGAQGITVDTCPHRPHRRRGPRPALRRPHPRPARQPPLPRHRHRRRPAHASSAPRRCSPRPRSTSSPQILRRDGSPVSATTALRDATDPARLPARCRRPLPRRRHHRRRTAPRPRTAWTASTSRRHRSSTASPTPPAWPTLRSHLALLRPRRPRPAHLLTDAVHAGDARRRPTTRPPCSTPASTTTSRDSRAHRTRTPRPGPLPWLPAIPTRLADDLDWGPYLTARHQQVLDLAAAVTDLAQPGPRDRRHRTRLGTALPRAPRTSDLRAESRSGAPPTDVPDTDLRPTGDPARSAHPATTRPRSTVPSARPGRATRTRNAAGTRPCPRPSATTPGSPRCASGSPASNAPASPSATTSPRPSPLAERRPLPDEHPAAALWWRLVPHLGPAALDADTHSGDLLAPDWLPAP